jgi:multicomponent Na+:H+ antiporter subunit D
MPSDLMIPPAFVMMLGALLLPLVPRTLRPAAYLLFAIITLVILWTLPDGLQVAVPFAKYTLVLCHVDQLSRVFGAIFAMIAIAGGVYGYHVKEGGHHVAALLYGGCALGITFAGDFLTLLIFWEVMAFVSAYFVWARGTADSRRAGMRYLLVHLFGGALLMAGILLHLSESGSLALIRLTGSGSVASWLILAGVALNAAIPPLHAWLADAYPRATVAGAVFLSAFTTKSAVYVLARLFPGTELLLFLGVMMALYGVVFAVLANDIREILAYHIISQVGYMVAGVGIGTEMAINGTTAHAFSHILYKALLFMGAGVVLHTTGKSKLTELGGLAKAMPVTVALYMIGAFSISGFPLFNGFISKSMVVSAAGEAHHDTAMLLLLLASVGTFLHTGLKLPYFTWFGEGKGIEPTKPPVNMHIGMAIVAFLCILFGVAPGLLYRHLPYAVTFEPYTMYHLTETVQILIFTFVAFWILRLKLAGEPTITLDTDWFYRRPARLLQRRVVENVGGIFDWTERSVLNMVKHIADLSRNPARLVSFFLPPLEGQAHNVEYDPDLYRPKTEVLIVLVLFTVVVISVLGLLWLFG